MKLQELIDILQSGIREGYAQDEVEFYCGIRECSVSIGFETGKVVFNLITERVLAIPHGTIA